MARNQLMSMLFLFLLLASGCKEFYDEEFEEFQEVQDRTVQSTSYTASLDSTDVNVPGMEGTVSVDVRDDKVTVDLRVNGIPQDIIQVHYGYIAGSCPNLSVALPDDITTTRSYSVTEESSTDALAEDLRSSGASSGSGDINLEGKSFVVKAFQNFSGLPNPSGTNVLNIACGELEVTDDSDASTDTTGTTGTETTTGTTL